MPSLRINPLPLPPGAAGRRDRGLFAAALRAWLGLFALGVASCTKIDGGAIEAYWVVRTYDGRAMDGCGCAEPAIARVRFVAVEIGADGGTGADVCAGRSECEFSCNSQRGATPFFVPAGRYAVSIAAIGPSGAVISSAEGGSGVRLPAPILRDVVYGQPTQLEAFAIEANCADRCGGGQTTQPCSAE